VRPPPCHRTTTAHLQAAYPFLAEGGLGGRGVYVGRDLFGGSYCHDPWELYRRGVLTGPNMVVLGQIGRGKSSFIKSYLWRSLAFGRHAWIVDPKGEYGPLARAAGVTPLRIGPGLGVRLNPLETAPGGGHPDAARRRSELLASIAEGSLGRPLRPEERTAVELALAAVAGRTDQPTLPAVVDALLRPLPASALSVHTDRDALAADGRPVALELRRLIEGDLAGMFDGPTTAAADLDRALLVLDLSAVYASPALGILMTCATAWLQHVLRHDDGVRRLVVVDEAWAILHDMATARWLRAGFKLARAHGVAYIAVLHRLSDLTAAGATGSQQQRLAEGLLSDSETRVVYGQSPSEVAAAVPLLGLTSTEAELLPQLPRGVAVWKVGARSFLIEHRLGRHERALVDTDARMGTGR
jgi:type IV secretory pathway VirB4 component